MTAVATRQIVLPPDVYDALELSALAFDGIGRGQYNEYDKYGNEAGPCCIIGHACYLDSSAYLALKIAGIAEAFNDDLVRVDERIEWEEYCRRGNIVRGEDQ